MWFDARAKLNEIAGQPPATSAATARPVSQVSQRPEAQKPALRVASVASVATSLTDAARAGALPTKPSTCAACGSADWRVSLTDTDGRALHVACWRAEQGDIPPTSTTQTPPMPQSSVTEGQFSVAKVANVATPSASITEPHDRTIGGQVLTWTGRVVSRADWQNLTDWERQGPNGRHWCAITKEWRPP